MIKTIKSELERLRIQRPNYRKRSEMWALINQLVKERNVARTALEFYTERRFHCAVRYRAEQALILLNDERIVDE